MAESPSMAAVHIQVKHCTDPHKDVPVWEDQDEEVPSGGLPVNLLIGQTGAGKTSVINMLCGGLPTKSKLASDTKHCDLYQVQCDVSRKECIILDTIGLLDTAATHDERLQYIRELIKFVTDKKLKVSRVFVTVPRDGKLMTDAVQWMSTLIDALGGSATVALVSYWLITKVNMESKLDKRLAAAEMDNPNCLLNTLRKHSLGFNVVQHGAENQTSLCSEMVSKHSGVCGLEHEQMNPDVEHHGNMKKNIHKLHGALETARQQVAAASSITDFDAIEKELRDTIDQAACDLAHCGKSPSKKQKYRDMIKEATAQLRSNAAARAAGASLEENRKQSEVLNARLTSALSELAKFEGLMSAFADLIGAASDEAARILGLEAHKFDGAKRALTGVKSFVEAAWKKRRTD